MNSQSEGKQTFQRLETFERIAAQCRFQSHLMAVTDAIDSLGQLKAIAATCKNHYLQRRVGLIEQSIIDPAIRFYSAGSGSIETLGPALQLFRYGASVGNTQALWKLIDIARERHFPDEVFEYEQIGWLHQLASEGQADASRALAQMYDGGTHFLKRDSQLANVLYAQAFRQLLPMALGQHSRWAHYRLGRLASVGASGRIGGCSNLDVVGDFEQAKFWFERLLEGEGDVDFSSHSKPKDQYSCLAAIEMAKMLHLTGKGLNRSGVVKRLRWAARFTPGEDPSSKNTCASAHEMLADYLDEQCGTDHGESSHAWLIRRASKLGSKDAQLRHENNLRINRARRHAKRPFLLEYDATFAGNIRSLKTGRAAFVRGLYSLLLSDETDPEAILEDFRKARALGHKFWPPNSENLLSTDFISATLNARDEIRNLLKENNFSHVFSACYAEAKFRFRTSLHYDRRFTHLKARLSISGKLEKEAIIHWLQLVSLLADCLRDPDRRFWNQLAIDGQFRSNAFENAYWRDSKIGRARRLLPKFVSASTANIGLCYNVRNKLDLPVKAAWRPRTKGDPRGWNKIPKITVSAEGFTVEPKPEKLATPPLLAEEDIAAVLTLALIDGGTRGRPFVLSLEPVEKTSHLHFKWKFALKEFDPPWLAGTEFGKTLYYTDLIHLQDKLGRSTFSRKHPRISAEYWSEWKRDVPWDTEFIGGASAWDSTSGRSTVTLKALALPENAPQNPNRIVLDQDFQIILKIDTGETIWKKVGEKEVEDRSIGSDNRRFRCTREGEYATLHYTDFATDYPVFERMALLHGLFSLACIRLKHLNLAPDAPILKTLAEKRTIFESRASYERRNNPNLVVFDLR